MFLFGVTPQTPGLTGAFLRPSYSYDSNSVSKVFVSSETENMLGVEGKAKVFGFQPLMNAS